jgi:hypothetical protein
MASGREPARSGVFASDQLKPSVHYTEPKGVGTDTPIPGTRVDPSPWGADSKSAPNIFVVMEVDEDPVVEPDPQAN